MTSSEKYVQFDDQMVEIEIEGFGRVEMEVGSEAARGNAAKDICAQGREFSRRRYPSEKEE